MKCFDVALSETLTDMVRLDLVCAVSDLVFNHVAHKALLDSCKVLLSKGGLVLVAFSHHRCGAMDVFFAFAAPVCSLVSALPLDHAAQKAV